ncbi:collagen alpha-1(III) chain-like [Canis lupus dingo]|uniref:collagen alpha-1(III) chain-like n=1 Tax=Canis lupus dingo TaxID=286419 RepID=UPI0020C1C8F3|nr:collagen alpha-1(III) chain-like [Canis lupus dingo]
MGVELPGRAGAYQTALGAGIGRARRAEPPLAEQRGATSTWPSPHPGQRPGHAGHAGHAGPRLPPHPAAAARSRAPPPAPRPPPPPSRGHPPRAGELRSLIISGQQARLPTEEPGWRGCLGSVHVGRAGPPQGRGGPSEGSLPSHPGAPPTPAPRPGAPGTLRSTGRACALRSRPAPRPPPPPRGARRWAAPRRGPGSGVRSRPGVGEGRGGAPAETSPAPRARQEGWAPRGAAGEQQFQLEEACAGVDASDPPPPVTGLRAPGRLGRWDLGARQGAQLRTREPHRPRPRGLQQKRLGNPRLLRCLKSGLTRVAQRLSACLGPRA